MWNRNKIDRGSVAVHRFQKSRVGYRKRRYEDVNRVCNIVARRWKCNIESHLLSDFHTCTRFKSKGVAKAAGHPPSRLKSKWNSFFLYIHMLYVICFFFVFRVYRVVVRCTFLDKCRYIVRFSNILKVFRSTFESIDMTTSGGERRNHN